MASWGHCVKIAGAKRQKIAMTSRMFLTLLLAGRRGRGRELSDILENCLRHLIADLSHFRDLNKCILRLIFMADLYYGWLPS